jgi:C2H2-type zinc finger
MDSFHYQYLIYPKEQQHLDENWELEEGMTSSQLKTELESVSCTVCGRNFRSKKALWGHRRCCKAASANSQNEGGSVSGFKRDVLESGWCMTAKRGRKPVLDITSPEFVAAGILVYMSREKSCNVDSTHDREKRKVEMDGSPPFSQSPMAQIVCGNKFMCVVCGKTFPSYQALGGHKASHGKDDMMENYAKDEREIKHSKELTSGDHRCEVCGMSYPSGQALGGHKRRHWIGSPFLAGNRSKASKFPASEVPCM